MLKPIDSLPIQGQNILLFCQINFSCILNEGVPECDRNVFIMRKVLNKIMRTPSVQISY